MKVAQPSARHDTLRSYDAETVLKMKIRFHENRTFTIPNLNYEITFSWNQSAKYHQLLQFALIEIIIMKTNNMMELQLG